jgi:hypothetical protein
MTNCSTNTQGNTCLPGLSHNPLNCKPWNITQQSKTNCLTNSYQQETLQIAGANINVFKLMGLYEQSLLLDLIGNGLAISCGDQPNFPASNAYTKINTQWMSLQSGSGVTISAYIGYDFGELKIVSGRTRYGIDTSVRHTITKMKIKQGNNAANRVTKARVERSEDGINWYGVAVVNLPDNNTLNTVDFKVSVSNRYWRLRPIAFNGSDCDSWIVQALEMHEFNTTYLYNFDPILMESRDRNYTDSSILLRGFYDLISPNTDLTRFGFELPSLTYQIKINFDSCVALLGRPIIIGDIVELPSEVQYNVNLIPIKKYLEVTDVTWDASTYTPGWQPTMLLVTALPALASQETQDVFGSLVAVTDSSGLFNNDDGNNPHWRDLSAISQNINQVAFNELPERGNDAANVIRVFEDDILIAADKLHLPLHKIGLNPKDLYMEGAIPPNNAPYTEGPEFPTPPKNGDYHRLTYVGLSKDVPARLYRFSTTKSRWVYLETDRRQEFNGQKSLLEEYTTSIHKESPKNIR